MNRSGKISLFYAIMNKISKINEKHVKKHKGE
jgi:hypothetical protein